jgi:hypothetical protein
MGPLTQALAKPRISRQRAPKVKGWSGSASPRERALSASRGPTTVGHPPASIKGAGVARLKAPLPTRFAGLYARGNPALFVRTG